MFLSSIRVIKCEVNQSSASWKSILGKWNCTRTTLALHSVDLWTLSTEVGIISLHEPTPFCRSHPLDGQALFLSSALGRKAVSVA